MPDESQTTVSSASLRDCGYREHPPSLSGERRIFQKAFDDARGRLYFVTFREWADPFLAGWSYDAQLCCDTATGGYLWATLKEPTIQETERRAALLWAAAGSVYYEEAERAER